MDMPERVARVMPETDDPAYVAVQLGRTPRGRWRVSARCPFRRPLVIETAPVLEDGTPFPTLYYLTCPWLVAYVDGLESACAVSEWSEKLATRSTLRSRMISADAQYRARREKLAGGTDPTPDVGIAGQRSPLSTKCLHAHVATYLMGIDDPVGEGVLTRMDSRACPDDLCSRLLRERQ